jgi:hypothetical protein
VDSGLSYMLGSKVTTATAWSLWFSETAVLNRGL